MLGILRNYCPAIYSGTSVRLPPNAPMILSAVELPHLSNQIDTQAFFQLQRSRLSLWLMLNLMLGIAIQNV